jgi:uncharacterized protein
MSALTAHAVRFSRELREAGVLVTPAQTALFVEALAWVNVFEVRAFHDAARACLVCRRDDLSKFETVFRGFWLELGMGGVPSELLNQAPVASKQHKPRPAEVRGDSNANPKSPGQLEPQRLSDRALTYSADEALKTKRFDAMNTAELEAARRALARFEWRIGQRLTRRFKASTRAERLDWRRSLRTAFRFGGEWVRLEWRARKTKPRPLVVLADVSGSMERYARMLLHFMHAVTQRSERVETFVFGTRLTRITRSLERRSVDVAVNEIGKTVNDWSGGTRIGSSFTVFNRTWAKRVLGRGAVILVISDGWDQGEPDVLARAMERLQKTCHRLIWLNPLIGTQNFEPRTRGLLAALPFVDDFLPVQNLQNFEQLADHLERINSMRSARRSGVKARAAGQTRGSAPT